MVQIENANDSLPHSGIQQADIVFEYLTEGGITRFTAIYFNPQGASKIEPLRSARLVSLKLLQAYGGVLFYSGASNKVLSQILQNGAPTLDENGGGGKYMARDYYRYAPHNLYTTGDNLRTGIADLGRKVSYPIIATGADPVGGDPVTQFTFTQSFAHTVSYAYSAATHTYTYSSEAGTEVDATNGSKPVQITNVVLIKVSHFDAGYVEDVAGADGIDFNLNGSGPADIYTRGEHFTGTWDLTQTDRPLKLLNSGGTPFLLPAGPTWFELVDP
jgi:hypothetical protein